MLGEDLCIVEADNGRRIGTTRPETVDGVFDGIGQDTSDEDADGRGGSEVDEAEVRNIEDDPANVGGGGLP